MSRQRIDALLAERGLAPSRTSAAESVRAGRVRIGRDGPLALKPSQLVADDAELLLIEQPRFVSRGGIKLENALEALAIDVAGLDCLDVGASTGGFTDCLLAARRRKSDRTRRRPRPARLGPAQRSPGDRDRAPQRARARARRAAVSAGAGDDRRLVHLAGQGDARGRRLPGAPAASCWRWSSRSSSSGAGGSQGGRRPRPGRPPRGAARGRPSAAEDAGLAVRGFASSGLPGPEGQPRDLRPRVARRRVASPTSRPRSRAVEP